MRNNDTFPSFDAGTQEDKKSVEKVNNGGESSSGESLIEIRLNEFVIRSELTSLDIRAVVVRCSSCGRQITKDIKKHRRLGVITCKECYDFYGSSEFSQDESGYNYCTWCGNGGKLIVCDYCPNGFCSACIRRNFGRAEISITTKEGWRCYCCNRKRLKPKVKFCDLIIENDKQSLKKEKKPGPAKTKKNAVTEKWLQDTFDESEEACKTFHRKISKLKAIGISKSESLKHIVKKMEQVINNHREDLKKINKSLSQQFLDYIELKNKTEEERLAKISNSNGDIIEINLDDEKTDCADKVNGIDGGPANVSANDDCVIIDYLHEGTEKQSEVKPDEKSDIKSNEKLDEKSDEKPDETPDVKSDIKSDLQSEIKDKQLPSTEEDEEDVSKHDDEKLKAKMSLLASSSDSEGVDGESLLHDETGVVNGDTKESPKGETSSVVKRKLDFSDSDDDFDLEGFDLDSKEKYKASETFANLDLSDDDAVVKEKQNDYDQENDSKLKLQSEVVLMRCDHLLENGETVVNISERCKNIYEDNSADEEEKLDKLIDSLCKFPLSKKSKSKSYIPTVSKKKKGPSKRFDLESSSSISLSSDDEEIMKPSEQAMKKVAKAKENLMNSDSSNNTDSEEEEEEEEENKKSKKSKAKKVESDSDDFQPRKKRKYDKLLHGPLLSDDEKKPKEKRERKSKAKKKRLLSSDEENNPKKESSKSSSNTTSDSDEDLKSSKQSRKRKRIKEVESSSEDEAKGETPTGKGRKNIKKIISQKKLADETKEAQLEEKERKKRIEERQKMYNKIVDTVDGKEIITRKMVLEVDKESKEEIVEIHPDLVCKLKPHQVNGVKFMWECTIETVKYLNKPGSGCILAHCMGLGKTLQVIAFVHTCLNNKYVNKEIKRVMVICPYNVALNWATEFDFWLDDVEGNILVHQLAPCKSNFDRLEILRYWYEEGGVLIISYDIFRRLAVNKIRKLRKKEVMEMHTFLLEPGPDIVVCDEGHVLKNETSAISKAMSKLRSKRRIVLTGTPLQNNLKEYHCMLSFVKPNLLGTSKEFRNRFVNPIMNGQYDDSTDYDVKLMKKRIHILHKLLEGCVHRCDYSALTKFLPPKHEFVISVKLSEIQMKMYELYLEKLTDAKKNLKCAGSTLFVDFNNLRCIWNHPYMTQVSHERNEYRKLLKDEDDEEFINDVSEEETTSAQNSTSDDDKLIENIREDNKRKDYRTRGNKGAEDSDDEIQEITVEDGSKPWYDEFISEKDRYNAQLSGKMVLLLEILKECEMIRDKVILFSQSLLTLDAIEDILHFSSSLILGEADKIQDAIGTWTKGLDYFRMDGSTSADFRKSYIDMFNDPNNDRARLFLISTKAGSLGTNLVGANRVIIFDTSWNPSHDVQAIFRAYRFGQVKPVYIYRLLAQGTMEEKIYDRQVTKLSLSCRVVDEQQIDRHFSAADLAELYTFDRHSTSNRPTPLVPKDRLLAELLIRNKEWIVTYHEHDSLLQSQNEQDLTEEERQAAWTEYENEREGKTEPPTSLNEDDINTIAREPDFTSADYEGTMIPDLKYIVSKLYENIKAQTPPAQASTLQIRKQLLLQVYKVRQLFQEKHVKTLRAKQEYIACGTVPNSVNKYLDELSRTLKSAGDYILKLQQAIGDEERHENLRRMNQQNAAQFIHMQNLNANRKQMPFIFRHSMPGMNVPQQAFINQRYTINRGMRPTSILYTRLLDVNRNQNVQQMSAEPTVTEVDDNTSIPVNESSTKTTNNTKSTVVIEEIS